jgi:hypothetical protein
MYGSVRTPGRWSLAGDQYGDCAHDENAERRYRDDHHFVPPVVRAPRLAAEREEDKGCSPPRGAHEPPLSVWAGCVSGASPVGKCIVRVP